MQDTVWTWYLISQVCQNSFRGFSSVQPSSSYLLLDWVSPGAGETCTPSRVSGFSQTSHSEALLSPRER